MKNEAHNETTGIKKEYVASVAILYLETRLNQMMFGIVVAKTARHRITRRKVGDQRKAVVAEELSHAEEPKGFSCPRHPRKDTTAPVEAANAVAPRW